MSAFSECVHVCAHVLKLYVVEKHQEGEACSMRTVVVSQFRILVVLISCRGCLYVNKSYGFGHL